MRALIINSMFVNAMYRRCADEIGNIDDIDLTIFMPESWRMNGRIMPLDPLSIDSPYRMLTGRASWKGFENRGFYTSGLVRAFKQSSPDVLFLMEEPFSIFAFETIMVKRMLGLKIPTVFFTWNNLSLNRFDYRPSWFYHNVARHNLQEFSRGLTANSDAIQVLREAGFRKPVSTIGYGVDTKKFSVADEESIQSLRTSLGINRDDRVIGYVGRLLKMKGVDLLIAAFNSLIASGQTNLKLLILGNGEHASLFHDQAQKLGIGHLIRYVPSVRHDEVTLYMHALDTLALPSRRQGMWAEQFGRVLIEGMAAGKIVLGSTSGAIPEVIGDAGFTFQENDVIDLTRQLRMILTLSHAEKVTIADRARNRAATQFSWKRFAEQSAHELRLAQSEGHISR